MTAREILIDRLFDKKLRMSGPCIDTLMNIFFDDPVYWIGDNYQAFRSACAEDDQDEIGRLIIQTLRRCADSYCDSEQGQLEMEDIEREMEEARRLDEADYEYDRRMELSDV